MDSPNFSRRNFLSSIAILSAGAAIGYSVNNLHFGSPHIDLQGQWRYFWKKSGGTEFHLAPGISQHSIFQTKGHLYKNGEAILFPDKNIIAQPTWIYWGNNEKTPADGIVTLFDKKHDLEKIGRLNRFEIQALYTLAKDNYPGDLLMAQCNNLSPLPSVNEARLKNKIYVKRHCHTHEVRFFKNETLVLNKQFIYHS